MIVGGATIQPVISAAQAYDGALLDLLVETLMVRMREALVAGDTVTLPGIGRLELRERRRYALANPVSGATHALGGERLVVFQPDKALLAQLKQGG